MQSTVVPPDTESSITESPRSRSAARRRCAFRSSRVRLRPRWLGASLKASNELNVSPMNSATRAPQRRDSARKAMTRLSTSSMVKVDSAMGVTTSSVANQSMRAIMAIAPNPKPTTPNPSTNSSIGVQASSTSSRMRLMASLEVSVSARAAGFAAMSRNRLRRTKPVR